MRPFEIGGASNAGWHPPGGPRPSHHHQQQHDDGAFGGDDDARRPLGPLADSGIGANNNTKGASSASSPSPFGNGGGGGHYYAPHHEHHHEHHHQHPLPRWASAALLASQAARWTAARGLSRCLPRGVDPRSALRTAFFVLSWYVLSTCLGLFNKVLVGQDHKGMFGRGAFPAPLFLSSAQFACQALLAEAALRSGAARRSQPARPPLSRQDYLRIALPNGVTTGLDIGFSNKSLVYITMSFYTMCKSTTPVWLLLFAFAWGLERPSWALGGVVAVIVSGLLLLVRGEVDFHPLGFVLVMTAACLSGLRFTLTQVLLHGRKGAAGAAGGGGGRGGSAGGGGGGGAAAAAAAGGAGAAAGGGSGGGGGGGSAADGRDRPHAHQHHHPQQQQQQQPHSAGGGGPSRSPSPPSAAPPSPPLPPPADPHHKPAAFGGPLEVVALLTPIMSATTLLLSLAWERLWATLPGSPYFASPARCAATGGLVLFSALLAFLMVWAEYQVIRETSALTFMVCGIVKEVLTVLVAVTALGDRFTPANAAGLAIVIAGVALFNAYKYRRLASPCSDDAAAAGGQGGAGVVTTSVVGAEGATLLPHVKAVRLASEELALSSSSPSSRASLEAGEAGEGLGGRRMRAAGSGGGRGAPPASGGAVFDLESPHDELGADRGARLQGRPSAGSGNSTPPPLRGAAAPAPHSASRLQRGAVPPPPGLRAASAAGAVMGAELGGLEGLVATAAEAEALEAARQQQQQQQQQQQR